MSGGHFDYQQYHIGEIAQTIANDIARALKPKPEMVHEDYWIINVSDNPGSYHIYPSFYVTFDSYEKAEAYLHRNDNVESIESGHPYADIFKGDILFQSKNSYMMRTPAGEQIPVLYGIHHCVFDHYPYDMDVLELSDETIETMKEAYKNLRIAQIYAQRIDWMMSGDDGEETMQARLKDDLEEFEKEFREMDWSKLPGDGDES